MVFLSLSARMLVNVEALNMVEAVGNVTRHRRATVILPWESGYRKFEVPALSGETIAHGYQRALVSVAKTIYEDPPICKWCERGEFFKHVDEQHSDVQKPRDASLEEQHRFEGDVVRKCLVEDIGGFLRTDNPPVKRTSRFQVGYMVPAFDALEASSLESQFHVRLTPSEARRASEEEGAGQMIYYVETGSALYTFSFNLDIDGIGRTSMINVEDLFSQEERKERVKVALGALLLLLEGDFGAKRSRFLPVEDIRALLVAVSDPLPFTVMPGLSKDFIPETMGKRERFLSSMETLGVEEDVELFWFSKEIEGGLSSHQEVLEKAIEEVLDRLE